MALGQTPALMARSCVFGLSGRIRGRAGIESGACCSKIHDKITGWIAAIVIGLIGVPFIFWGINVGFGAASYAAKVASSDWPWWETLSRRFPLRRFGAYQKPVGCNTSGSSARMSRQKCAARFRVEPARRRSSATSS
mgnify:CR=1 FL=1